ncbi:MAG TPA: hypothetical protein VNU84_00590 [Candidatus Acidoferrum sp.]|jgi:hypothetical protein|nr:hypothetical protein [Candidatus Acidoferrum sp.]
MYPDASNGGRGQPPAIDPAVFEKLFPGFDAKQSAKLKLLSIACGTDDSLIGNRCAC